MSPNFDFCDERAREAAKAAADATLDNVRDRNLRSEKTWRALADQAQRVANNRAKAEALKQAELEAEQAALIGAGETSG